MHKIKVYTIGKIKESWLEEGIAEYTKRLKPVASFEWILAKNLEQLEHLLESESSFFALDPLGKAFTSESFAKWIETTLVQEGSRLSLVIGGSEGLSDQLRKRAKLLFSLSPLTFTHQMTRLILLEQVYRAFEISKGTAYHK